MSGHGKKPTEGGTLTYCRRQKEGLVRIQKETERGTLTSWRWQREELFRTWKETERARCTHKLDSETAEGGTCQDMERDRQSEAHSQPGDSRGRDLSGHSMNRSSKACSLPGDGRGRDLSGHGMKSTEQGMLTSWRRQREGLVRTRKGTERVMHTHFLETAEGGTCQNTEKKPTERGALTFWRQQREGVVKTWKETDRARHTHKLETAEGKTCQDKETNRASDAYSLSGDGRRRDLSG